jgi:hypothetical protein
MDLAFDISQLDNLRSLHEHEEKLRDESLKFIADDPTLSEMMCLATNAMGVLFGFVHDHKAKSDDDLTLQYLGIRLFNTAGASIKLALGGYAQQALGHTRDIVEVAFLLDYLKSNPHEIVVWKNADVNTLKRRFGPLQIRIALDGRDGNKERKRQKTYAILSENASHASFRGFVLTTKDGAGQVGPFFDGIKLQAWVHEITLRIVPAAELLGVHFKNPPAEVAALFKSFRKQSLEWLQRQRSP